MYTRIYIYIHRWTDAWPRGGRVLDPLPVHGLSWAPQSEHRFSNFVWEWFPFIISRIQREVWRAFEATCVPFQPSNHLAPSEHPNPRKNRLKWVVHLPTKMGSQNGFDNHTHFKPLVLRMWTRLYFFGKRLRSWSTQSGAMCGRSSPPGGCRREPGAGFRFVLQLVGSRELHVEP